MTPDPFATSAGGYVLGALSAEERHAFEQHLRECTDCRAEVRHLAGLPGLLSRVPLRDVLTDDPRELPEQPEPPDTLLPALLDRVRHTRRRRRGALLSGSLAMAACVVAVLALLLLPGVRPGGPGAAPTATPEAFAMTKVTPSPINATARVTAAPGGSRIDLSCIYRAATHGGGWTYGEPAYTLAVVDRYGHTHRAATWRIATGETSLTSTLTVTRDEIAVIQIRDAHNKVLLRLRWPPSAGGTSPSGHPT